MYCVGCGGDKNAVPGCGVNCGKKCSDIGKKGPFVCPRICRVNGCDCKKGFYYDNIKKKCVPPGQCSQVLCEDADVQPVLLRQGNYGFTGKLLYRIMLANPGISAVTSAFSAMGSLGNLALYAKGDTYSEIMKLLNLETNQQIRCSFPPFLDEVKASDGTELRLATKVYVKNEYELSVPFKDDAVNVFRAETESIDFNNANQAADTINQWVSGATNGKITELATPDLFDSLTRLVLANAIYFKGTWLTKFDPAKTTKEDFYVDSQTTKTVDMMHIKNKINYNYLTDLDAQAVQLPYKDENISFIIILPNDKDGISTLVEKLQDGAIFDAAVSTFYSELVDLSLPKMFEETSIDLKQMLKEIGVKTIFDNVNAQLDGMIVPNESLYATDAVLKATITVDENGSEAAAANVIVIGTRSGPRTVIADHPFVYLIKVGKTVVFYGLYCG